MGFFDDLGKKAEETYKSAADKTNKITKELKLKSTVNEKKSKINELYVKIGIKVYENKNIDAEIEEMFLSIDQYLKEIEELKLEILACKDMKLCTGCSKEIKINAKFCPSCGAQNVFVEENSKIEEELDNSKEITEEDK